LAPDERRERREEDHCNWRYEGLKQQIGIDGSEGNAQTKDAEEQKHC